MIPRKGTARFFATLSILGGLALTQLPAFAAGSYLVDATRHGNPNLDKVYAIKGKKKDTIQGSFEDSKFAEYIHSMNIGDFGTCADLVQSNAVFGIDGATKVRLLESVTFRDNRSSVPLVKLQVLSGPAQGGVFWTLKQNIR